MTGTPPGEKRPGGQGPFASRQRPSSGPMGMLDVKLNRTLLDNIMLLGLRHAIEPLDAENQPVRWELP